MLKHVYIDNYRCLVNFELSLGRQQLILGLNGSGKSTLLEALRAVKTLVTGDARSDLLFPDSTRTRWAASPEQTIELDVDLPSLALRSPDPSGEPPVTASNGVDISRYRLRLEFDAWGAPARTRIKREAVFCDGRPIFEFVEGEVRLFNDNFVQKVTYPFDWFRSALATVQPRAENLRLMHFKKWIGGLHCLRLNPHAMSSRSDSEDPEPAIDMANFASWYRYMAQERTGETSGLRELLRRVIPAFESLDSKSAGANLRRLEARFACDDRREFSVAFDELSDGQRVLVCLYALLGFLVEHKACIFLDEPENYIAIPEIQPWLMELRDRIEDRGGQVILISHHPELIDYLAPEIGLVFERSGAGPVRVRKYESGADTGLPPSERIARGWQADG